jgi:hypothetical protein
MLVHELRAARDQGSEIGAAGRNGLRSATGDDRRIGGTAGGDHQRGAAGDDSVAGDAAVFQMSVEPIRSDRITISVARSSAVKCS